MIHYYIYSDINTLCHRSNLICLTRFVNCAIHECTASSLVDRISIRIVPVVNYAVRDITGINTLD